MTHINPMNMTNQQIRHTARAQLRGIDQLLQGEPGLSTNEILERLTAARMMLGSTANLLDAASLKIIAKEKQVDAFGGDLDDFIEQILADAEADADADTDAPVGIQAEGDDPDE